MARYPDPPMGDADATLLALAEEIGSDRVFHLDRHHFSVFRLPCGRPLRLLP